MTIRLIKIIISLACIFSLSACISASQQFKLSGTQWILDTMYGQGLLPNTAITLKITEGDISGSSGCNLYGARYSTRSKNGINIKEVAHTDMGCHEPAGIMQQEEAYLSAVQKSTNYKYDGENLFIMDKQGNILLQYRLLPKFKANPEALKGKTWRLIYADRMVSDELGPFMLWFDEGTFRGTTSCRDYKGTYQTEADSIHVYSMEMVPGADCAPDIQTLESVYTSLLSMIEQYSISPNRLELYTVQHVKLVYEIVSDGTPIH